MKQVVIDAQIAGASGDMFLSALLSAMYGDLEKPLAQKKREQLIKSLIKILPKATKHPEKTTLEITIEEKNICALQGIHLDIQITEPHAHLHLPEAQTIMEKGAQLLSLNKKAKAFCQRVLTILFEAESEAHGDPIEKVHLHEAGSLDTFLDILGAAYLLEKLDLFNAQLSLTPLAIGSGTVTFSHGTLPVPAPAVTAVLKRFNLSTIKGKGKGELLTPTGVCLIAALTEMLPTVRYERMPPLIINTIGIGFGTKEFEAVPNALRIIIGESTADPYQHEEIAIIETNIDDCSGETIGYITEHLLEKGAKDVYLTPIYMKKGRPGVKITILCEPEKQNFFANELIMQTSTIGVRISYGWKTMLNREIRDFSVTIKGKTWPFKAKISFLNSGKIVNYKAEFNDIKKIAKNTNLSIKEVTTKTNQLMTQQFTEKNN